jgi:hypothetical protein
MSGKPSRPLATFLGENDTVAPVMAQVRRNAHVQKLFAEALDTCGRSDLIASSRVASISGTTLVVAAASAASAAILKQMLPRLTENLRLTMGAEAGQKSENQMQEQQVTGIRVVLQPDPTWWKPAPPPRRVKVLDRVPMDDSALAALTDQLADSPLKKSLAKIALKRKQALTGKAKKA